MDRYVLVQSVALKTVSVDKNIETQRDSATRFSASGFFLESVSTKREYLIRPLQFFQKFAKIFTAQGAPPV
jgi:hypothetical protein